MHIGVLTHNYPRFPGDFSGIFIRALCDELAAQGEQITVYAPYDSAYSQHAVGNKQYELRLYRYIWPASLHRLGYTRSMQADLALRLNSYLLSPGMFASAIASVLRDVRRARRAGNPIDVLHAHWLLPGGFIGAIVSRLAGIPLVVSVPGSDAQVAAANPLFRWMARQVFHQASLLTANSHALRDAVIDLGADPNKFDLIIYGTDPDKLRPDSAGVAALRRSLNVPDGTVVLLAVGRMVPKKGFDGLLRALADPALREKPVAAVVVGEGDCWQAWQGLARDLGVAEKMRWVGNVPFEQIGLYYNLADVLVMPSVSQPADGLNVCVLDAMSCAKPVIGSNVAGNPLAVVDGETGLIVPEGNVGALAGALLRLVDDGELRQQMGAASRARIENGLGWPHLARRYREHFARLIEG